MTPSDHITQLIESLKKFRLSLLKFEDIQFKNTISYLSMAIKSLEDYKISQGIFIPKLPPHINNIPKETTSQSLSEWSLSQQAPYGRSGYTWVKPFYRKGKLVRGHWRKKL
jgi:hypothetical protein